MMPKCALCETAIDGECYPCELKRRGKRLPVMSRNRDDGEDMSDNARPSWAGDDTTNVY